MAADGGCERNVAQRINAKYKACGVLKKCDGNTSVMINLKKCQYQGVIILTALYGAGAWGKRNFERMEVTVLEMKRFRSLVGVSRKDRVRNEEVPRTAGIERNLSSRVDQRALKWFGHIQRKKVLYGLKDGV